MMTEELVQTPPSVQRTVLADGVLVQLSGGLVGPVVDDLREALLRHLPSECKDVIVDAGRVTEIDDMAIAILLAAKDWVQGGQRRFAVSRTSPAIDEALRDAKLTKALPRLGRPERLAVVPAQNDRRAR